MTGKKFPNGHWQDRANVEAAMKEAMQANHGLIPGAQWFTQNGYRGMLQQVYAYRHGTMDDFRKQFGVYGKKYCPNCEIVKDITEFRMRTKQADSKVYEQARDSVCRICSSQASADYRKTRTGRIAEAYRRTRGRAKEMGWEFNLTKEWIAARLEAIDWKCEETGIPLERGEGDPFRSIYALSVDRIDSARGYTTDNVRFVINWVNIAKQHLSNEQFVELCTRVADAHR